MSIELWDLNSNILAWKNIKGKPVVVVTPSGPTDGGDFGPNTVGTKTAGIQEAINSLPTTGGLVVLVAGTYVTTISITIPDRVSLYGVFAAQSVTATTIKYTGDNTKTILQSNTLVSGSGYVGSIKDITFVYGADGSTNPMTGASGALYLSQFSGLLENLVFQVNGTTTSVPAGSFALQLDGTGSTQGTTINIFVATGFDYGVWVRTNHTTLLRTEVTKCTHPIVIDVDSQGSPSAGAPANVSLLGVHIINGSIAAFQATDGALKIIQSTQVTIMDYMNENSGTTKMIFINGVSDVIEAYNCTGGDGQITIGASGSVASYVRTSGKNEGAFVLRSGTSNTVKIGIDSNALKMGLPIKDNLAQTTLNGTAAGTLVWSQVRQGVSYKRFVGYFNAYNSTQQTVTFSTAFTNTPRVTDDTGLGSTATTTTLTIPTTGGAAKSGVITVEGF